MASAALEDGAQEYGPGFLARTMLALRAPEDGVLDLKSILLILLGVIIGIAIVTIAVWFWLKDMFKGFW
jgi:hypothetical protein